ncbi:MAG TPA: FIST N-terminal domain-containing protein [Polyangia bacterium]|jgi:hypothetical protein
MSGIRTAHSRATEARAAAHEFHDRVWQPDPALVVFFCSSGYDLDVMAREMSRAFAGVPVVGCTTAGEFGPSGYREHSLSGASLPAGACTAVAGHLDNLQGLAMREGRAFAQGLLQELEGHAPAAGPQNTFAFLLIDGLSLREELATHVFQDALGTLPLVGGSAGDDLRFARTWVFHDGAFRTDNAVLALCHTTYPFRTFKAQHFVAMEERLVVTEADAAHRVVKEINGRPAVEEYARVVGVPVAELTSERFAAAPVVTVIDGLEYVRAIQRANPDGSLTFFCAIDEGLVLRVAHGGDLVASLERTFERLREELGAPQLVVAFDCILRHLEMTREDLAERVGEILRRNNAVGFSSYGEQFGGLHVNQTFTGIAFGEPSRERDG